MSGEIKAVLFDFGGVFTDSPFHAVHAYGEALGIGAREVTGIVFGSYENDGDHPWHQLERGEITLESAREQILNIGLERDARVDIYELSPPWQAITAARPTASPWWNGSGRSGRRAMRQASSPIMSLSLATGGEP